MTGTTRWYAAKVHANGEASALRNLARQGYPTFCPRIAKTVRHARRTTQRLAPLFPGYLFVEMDPAVTQWRPVDATPGIAALVKFGGRPAPLPFGLVEALISGAAPDGEIRAAWPQPELGSEVRVVGGAFDDWIGKVVALPDAERVTLLIALASRQIKVTLPSAHTLPAFRTESAA